MTTYELYLPPSRPKYDRKTGRFLKGHTPANKGKKWDEFLTKRKQKRCAKGWANLEKNRPTSRPDNAGRCRKKVVVVTNDGKFKIFSYSKEAADWVGGNRENVCRCCRENMSKKVCKHNWRIGQKKGADLVNTDHKYKGYRFYFYDDPDWWHKAVSV